MIVMPADNTSKLVKRYFKEYPDRIAQLMGPNHWKNPIHKYALDNGCFTRFNELKYFNMLKRVYNLQEKPMFITVPDVVGCHDRTIALFDYYFDYVATFGYPIAFVAQDGCTLETVPAEADWIFIGGLDPWKVDNIHKFIGNRPVHVGRVNTLKRLEYCEGVGVTSVDGTGWMRARGKQYYDFIDWFEGNTQKKLF